MCFAFLSLPFVLCASNLLKTYMEMKMDFVSLKTASLFVQIHFKSARNNLKYSDRLRSFESSVTELSGSKACRNEGHGICKYSQLQNYNYFRLFCKNTDVGVLSRHVMSLVCVNVKFD